MENKLLACMTHYRDDPFNFSVLRKAKRFIIDDVNSLVEFSRKNRATNLMLPFHVLAIETAPERNEGTKDWMHHTLIIARQLSDREIVISIFLQDEEGDGWTRISTDIMVTLKENDLFDISCKYLSDKLSPHDRVEVQKEAIFYTGYVTAAVFGIISFLQKEPDMVEEEKGKKTKRAPGMARLGNNVDIYRRVSLSNKRSYKSKSLGGTHSSPRMHERRGYWRRGRNGNKHWVAPTIVNPTAGAAIINDYVVKVMK